MSLLKAKGHMFFRTVYSPLKKCDTLKVQNAPSFCWDVKPNNIHILHTYAIYFLN